MKKILFVGSEASPFAATGGLGDVLGSLPAAVAKKGGENFDVRVIIPLYGAVGAEWRALMKTEYEWNAKLSWRNIRCAVKSLFKDGVTWYFVDNEDYYKRDRLYGCYDDGERFAFFCAAVCEFMGKIDFYPDILHAHDWQAALAVIYLKRKYALNERYSEIKTIFTIHNIEYQGQFDLSILGDVFGLSKEDESLVRYGDSINLMKGALACCDRLSTVSPRYAEEIRTPEYSHGLHHIIIPNSYKLSGILNGIDYETNNPETDPDLCFNYTWETQAKKLENKLSLQRELSLPENKDIPLIAMVTRLVSHKGIDLVTSIADRLAGEGFQMVFLGTGESRYEDFLRGLEERRRECVRSMIMFDRKLSKRIYAAADIFLMPSKSEPCGLAQMICSRYGVIPVVRETGGLADSIKGYWEDEAGIHGNGFTFANFSHEELYERTRAAAELWKDKKKRALFVAKIMKTDFSWDASAGKYLELYQSL